MPKRPLRFVHTSDLHLDAYVGVNDPNWVDRRAQIRAGFEAVLSLTQGVKADALLIAGDIFDSNRAQTETVEWFLDRCASIAPTAVIAINGNHDALGNDSVYARHDLASVENLIFLLEEEGESFTFPELKLVCWGRGFHESDLDFRPLDGLPAREDSASWHVALAHGHLVRGPDDAHRSMLIEPSQIDKSGWDYIALGHWEHHAEAANTPVVAVYSGAPVPLARREFEMAAVVVDCDPASGIRWARTPLERDREPLGEAGRRLT